MCTNGRRYKLETNLYVCYYWKNTKQLRDQYNLPTKYAIMHISSYPSLLVQLFKQSRDYFTYCLHYGDFQSYWNGRMVKADCDRERRKHHPITFYLFRLGISAESLPFSDILRSYHASFVLLAKHTLVVYIDAYKLLNCSLLLFCLHYYSRKSQTILFLGI